MKASVWNLRLFLVCMLDKRHFSEGSCQGCKISGHQRRFAGFDSTSTIEPTLKGALKSATPTSALVLSLFSTIEVIFF